jgi:hypothetical protein
VCECVCKSMCVYSRERESANPCESVCVCVCASPCVCQGELSVFDRKSVCSGVFTSAWIREREMCVCVYSLEKCYIYTTRISAICDVVYAW